MGPQQPALVSRYNFLMRRIFAIAVMCAALAVAASAQMRGTRGVPGSVTSFGFGGHPGFRGVPSSVTSPGFGAPRNFGGVRIVPFGVPFGRHRGFFFNGRFHNGAFFPGTVAPFFPTPIVVPFFDWEDGAAMQQPQTIVTQPAQPQPIVIVVPDRDREPAPRDPAPERREAAPAAAAKPEPPPTPTIVVLRSGEKLELTDYAVTGDTLYDLHGGRTKKIAVSDIDLPTTVKLNEERGIEFTLPNAARVHIQ